MAVLTAAHVPMFACHRFAFDPGTRRAAAIHLGEAAESPVVVQRARSSWKMAGHLLMTAVKIWKMQR